MLLHQLKSETDGQSATIGIRWCLSPEEIKRLKSNDREAKIIITVLHIRQRYGEYSYVEESRKVLPITAASTFISFRNPGRHVICAGILDTDCYSPEVCLSVYRHHSGYNSYDKSIISTSIAFIGDGTTEGIGMRTCLLLMPASLA
ncbi:MAG: hypothetical protein WC668_04405 [Patescibacteria group bacterium]|jgi:hypothetical protein